jgi:hypothetical protein
MTGIGEREGGISTVPVARARGEGPWRSPAWMKSMHAPGPPSQPVSGQLPRDDGAGASRRLTQVLTERMSSGAHWNASRRS